MGPYAWEYKGTKQLAVSQRNPMEPSSSKSQHVQLAHESKHHVPVEPVRWDDAYLCHSDLAGLPRSQDVFRKIEADPRITLKLPKPGVTAGGVLAHATKLFEKLLEQHKPMTFKFGITHDASMRYHNPVFGYRYSKDKLENMIIIYGASNPHGPAFLEGCLIHLFGGFMVAIRLLSTLDMDDVDFIVLESVGLLQLSEHTCFNLGLPGCKNERQGGDSLRDVDSGPYLTYVVFTSWKRPSMQVRSLGGAK